MTLNILFMTITIKKRKMTVEEAIHHKEVQKIYDENRDRQISFYRPY